VSLGFVTLLFIFFEGTPTTIRIDPLVGLEKVVESIKERLSRKSINFAQIHVSACLIELSSVASVGYYDA
jgi:hypothetical protein